MLFNMVIIRKDLQALSGLKGTDSRLREREMASKKDQMIDVAEAYPMIGGVGPYSYFKNSYQQGGVMNAAKKLVRDAISEKLDVLQFYPSTAIRVADLGCSVGPNTFFAVENLVEAVELKCRNQGLQYSQIPEFQVFFNDHVCNDFNTLFSSLPPSRRYHAAGVPGSYHSRLFPSRSLHIVHLSYAIHWLSQVPERVVDRSSPAWNQGRIDYSSAPDDVVEAYSAQWAEDMARFLQARAEEIADGGLMMIIFPARPDGTPHSQLRLNIAHDLLGSCLIEMAKKGIVREEEVVMFNLPLYFTSGQELEEATERNGYFSIESMDPLPPITYPESSLLKTGHKARAASSVVRAALEGVIRATFGDEILDPLFDSYSKKMEEEFSVIESGITFNLCAVLKRKARIKLASDSNVVGE